MISNIQCIGLLFRVQERNAREAALVSDILRSGGSLTTIKTVERPISHRDVTTTMRLLSDIQVDVRAIRRLLEEENGEEEEEAGEADR
jgi:hypothetical protein